VSSRCHTCIPTYQVLFPPTTYHSLPFRSVVRSSVAHPEVVGSTPGSVTFPSRVLTYILYLCGISINRSIAIDRERDAEDIEAYLKADGSRPDLGTPPSEVCLDRHISYTHAVCGMSIDRSIPMWYIYRSIDIDRSIDRHPAPT